MNPLDRVLPSRPWIDELGVAIELDVGGRRRKIVITQEALDAALGPPPPHVEDSSKRRMWIGAVQHNIDVIKAAASKKLAKNRELDDPVLLGPEDIAGRQ